MILDVTTVQVLVVVFFATLIRSTFGFGEGLIAVPLLAFLLPLDVAAPLVVLLSITIAAVVVVQDWRKIHVRSAGWLLVPTFAGVPLGILLLASGPQRVVKGVLAVVILGFSGYFLVGKKPHGARPGEPAVDAELWFSGGGAGRSVWDEWASAGDLRSDAAVVSAAFSSDAAGILSACERGGDGGLLDGGAVGAGGDALLPGVAGGGASGDLSGHG